MIKYNTQTQKVGFKIGLNMRKINFWFNFRTVGFILLVSLVILSLFLIWQLNVSVLNERKIRQKRAIVTRILGDFKNDQTNFSFVKNSQVKCGYTLYKLNTNERIINGFETNPHSQPWLISLRKLNSDGGLSNHLCGGALISDQFVITAAHCVDNYQSGQIAIVTGLENVDSIDQSNVYTLDKFWIHEGYSNVQSDTFVKNDISLLKLSRSVEWTENGHVAPVCLPSNDEAIFGSNLIVSGWGNTFNGFGTSYPNRLKSTRLKIINGDASCSANGPWDSADFLCAIGSQSNACFGKLDFTVLIDFKNTGHIFSLKKAIREVH